jgi:hypothetical protein
MRVSRVNCSAPALTLSERAGQERLARQERLERLTNWLALLALLAGSIVLGGS